MSKYLIDGRFLASMSTGVDRYAYQVLKALDPICKNLDLSILIPGNAVTVPKYQNIKVIQLKQTRFWTQLIFGGYAALHRMIPINLCNEVSLLAPKGIVCLHDVCYAETQDVYPQLKDFSAEEINWFLKVYRRIRKKAGIIITVSEFSKSRIVERLGVDPDRIVVIGNGWQHFNEVCEDPELLNQYERLKEKQYYFTLTSANKNKNVNWVLETARRNKEDIFVIAGKNLDQTVDFSQYPNVIFTGYASDELAKTLMTHAKAFLFPSFYEGFGIPPLEALSTGTQIVVSSAASLPEIFGKSAHYISPTHPCNDLEKLLNEPVADPASVLSTYGWEHAGEKLYEVLQKYNQL